MEPLSIPLWAAVCGLFGAAAVGGWMTLVCLSMWKASYTPVIVTWGPEHQPEPMLEHPVPAAPPVVEPESVAPVHVDDDLAGLHTRARERDWYYAQPAQPEPATQVPLLLYDASWNTVLGATGSFSVADLEHFMASDEAQAVARGFKATHGKRKRSKAGVR